MGRPPGGTRIRRLALWAGVLSAPVVVLAYINDVGIAVRLADALPEAWVAAGAGTGYPGFSDAYPHVIRWSVLVIGAAGAIAGVVGRPEIRRVLARFDRRVLRDLVVPVAITLAAFLVYLWFAYPHNGYPTNSRVHWVDVFYSRSDSFWYTLVKVHRLVYDVPHWFHAANGAANTLLVYLLGREFFPRAWVPHLMAGAFLVSSNMLLFADTAEDVQLNVFVLLLATLMFVKRSPILAGAALFLGFLGRPQFALLAVGLFAAEVLVGATRIEAGSVRRRLFSASRNRFVIIGASTFAALFVGWHLFLVFIDANWLFTNGKIIDNPNLGVEPRPVDGFLIEPFRGTYIAHALWIFPSAVWLLNAYALSRWRDLEPRARVLLFGVWIFFAVNLAFHEYEPGIYFNVRYITYYFPLLLVSAFLALAVLPPRLGVRARAGITALLVLSVLTPFPRHFEIHDNVQRGSMTPLFDDRFELRDLGNERTVVTDLGRGARNYVAYLLQADVRSFRIQDPGAVPPGSIVFTVDAESWRDGQLVLKEEDAAVLLGS